MAMTTQECEQFDRLREAFYNISESIIRAEEELAALDRIAAEADGQPDPLAELSELRRRISALEKPTKPAAKPCQQPKRQRTGSVKGSYHQIYKFQATPFQSRKGMRLSCGQDQR